MTTVLIADDDEGLRFPIVSLFEDFGFTVLQAESEEEVLKDCEQADIWIIDARLPSGAYEGIRAVQRLVEEKEIKPKHSVIFISVDPESFAEDRLVFLSDKSVKYVWVEKPFEPEFLLHMVNRFREEAP
jgi:CheY-like chemotaxis protein